MSIAPTLKRDADSGIIYMHWSEPGPKGQRGRSRRLSTGTKDDEQAKTVLARFLLIDKEQPLPDRELTVAECWDAYDTKHVQKNVVAVRSLENSWANLKPHFGELRVSEVSQDAADAYETKRRRGTLGRKAAEATVRRELKALCTALNWCANPRRNLIPKAPALDLPAASEPNDRWLRDDELGKMLAAADRLSKRTGNRMNRGERFVWLALETAAREEAILELTWPRVDFHTGVIDYNVPGRPRTKKRRAAVPISARLRPILERAYTERLQDEGLVLDHGGSCYRVVTRIAANAGLTGVSPHVLRHTAATHMARRGVPLWIIAKILGNTVAMVERVYAKHAPEDLRDAVNLISVSQNIGVAL